MKPCVPVYEEMERIVVLELHGPLQKRVEHFRSAPRRPKARRTVDWDAIVIGAGYFGCRIALRLARTGMRRILLVEAETGLMKRASRWNQARVHGGYHYPRSQLTARASRRSYERFLAEHSDAVVHGMRGLYAIARGSNVSPSQFEALCESIDAPLNAAPARMEHLFDPDLVEAVYSVEEIAFDADRVAARLAACIAEAGIELVEGRRAIVEGGDGDTARVRIGGHTATAGLVFNCSYANLDRCGVPLRAELKRERSELALIDPPRELAGWGVTVMDGPFFSTMPYPSLDLYTLSHVRFTPVFAFARQDAGAPLPPGRGPSANADAMLRDAARFLPRLRDARLHGSFYEVKTVLVANESDDGRPVLLERWSQAPNVISVLGSKLDNVYDVLEAVDDIAAKAVHPAETVMA